MVDGLVVAVTYEERPDGFEVGGSGPRDLVFDEPDRVRRLILAWARANPSDYPWRGPTVSDWGRLAAELMLQRTSAQRVRLVWTEFYEQFADPSALSGREDEILRLLAPLGLAKRAGALIRTAAAVSRCGSIPDDREGLLALPGVGVYTADAYLCFARGVCSTLIDANISRLVHRLAGESAPPQAHRTARTRAAAARVMDDRATPAVVRAILDFTIEVCRVVPACRSCPIVATHLCAWGWRVTHTA